MGRSVEDMRQILEGKMVGAGRELRNVQVVLVSEVGDGVTVRLKDDGGIFMEVPPDKSNSGVGGGHGGPHGGRRSRWGERRRYMYQEELQEHVAECEHRRPSTEDGVVLLGVEPDSVAPSPRLGLGSGTTCEPLSCPSMPSCGGKAPPIGMIRCPL